MDIHFNAVFITFFFNEHARKFFPTIGRYFCSMPVCAGAPWTASRRTLPGEAGSLTSGALTTCGILRPACTLKMPGSNRISRWRGWAWWVGVGAEIADIKAACSLHSKNTARACLVKQGLQLEFPPTHLWALYESHPVGKRPGQAATHGSSPPVIQGGLGAGSN